MSKNSETGHAINVANFAALISFATGYGSKFNPGKEAIKLPALNSLYLTAKATMNKVTDAGTAFINATNARQIVFTPVQPLATRIMNALAATDAAKETLADARTINRKVQGSRKGSKIDPSAAPEPGDSKQVSAAQLSYNSRVANFKKMVALVAAEPSYTPNETDLQPATLNTLAETMDTNNKAVIDAITGLSNTRIERNDLLYLEKTGLYDRAQEVKKYVASVFGATSPEFKQVNKIAFTKPRKKIR